MEVLFLIRILRLPRSVGQYRIQPVRAIFPTRVQNNAFQTIKACQLVIFKNLSKVPPASEVSPVVAL